jgi:hypothetical protein
VVPPPSEPPAPCEGHGQDRPKCQPPTVTPPRELAYTGPGDKPVGLVILAGVAVLAGLGMLWGARRLRREP